MSINARLGNSLLTTKTSAVSHFYANSATGLDTNDGLTAGTAKATLEGVKAILPDFSMYSIVIHLEGTFEITPNAEIGYAYEQEYQIGVLGAPYLYLDGGSGLTVVADDGGSPWTADIFSVSGVGTAGNGWTTNEYRGLWIQILTGAAAGQTRTIYSNTADTIVPALGWSVDPGACTYQIVRPSTVLYTTDVNDCGLAAYVLAGGQAVIQNLYFGSHMFINPKYNTMVASCIISGEDFAVSPLGWGTGHAISQAVDKVMPLADLKILYQRRDYATDILEAYQTTHNCGVSVLDCWGFGLQVRQGGVITVRGLVVKKADFYGCIVTDVDSLLAGDGSFLYTGALIRNVNNDASIGQWRGATAGGVVIEGGSLEATKCVFSSLGHTSISNSSTHGIILHDCIVRKIRSTVTGTGNAGAGLLAEKGSRVYLETGESPTITGTVGDTSFDGSTEASTWAAITAGTSQVDLVGLNIIESGDF